MSADIAKINAEGAAALSTLYRDAGFSADQVTKKVQDFQDGNTYNDGSKTSVDYSNILVSTMVTMVPMIIRWQLINIRCLVSLLQRYYLV